MNWYYSDFTGNSPLTDFAEKRVSHVRGMLIVEPYAYFLQEGFFMQVYPHMSDIIVAYFSWRGHTEKVAGEIAKRLGAGLVKIEPYGRIHLFSGAIKAAMRAKSAIRPCKTDISDTKGLVIACPVWARKVPPYMNEYLSRVSGCNGKPFGIAIEMSSAGAGNATAIIRSELELKGMRFVTSLVTLEKEVENSMIGDRVDLFAAEIQKAVNSG